VSDDMGGRVYRITYGANKQ